ncbi:MAG: hypothetical protein ACTSQJ_12055 [Promethearchaeota archaeon]
MITIPRRKQTIKYSRKFACKYLTPKGDISNSFQPLCYCPERDLVLGTKAYVCQVCTLYNATNVKITDIYEESKKEAEKRIKERELELAELKIEEFVKEEDIDISIEEFEEDEEDLPIHFEKRKAGKEEIEDSEEFAEVECPFCGEIFDDLASHIQNCEFAPDDASIEDIISSKPKKRKRKKKGKPGESLKTRVKSSESKEKKKCPYCGKEFIRLGRHLNSCKKKPSDASKKEEGN